MGVFDPAGRVAVPDSRQPQRSRRTGTPGTRISRWKAQGSLMDASGLAGLSSLHQLVLVWAAGVGACIGSFLNVVVARLPQGESIVRPRSRCPHCKTPIAWYDNLPVLSYLLLRARCRACRAPIAPRYPLVELS